MNGGNGFRARLSSTEHPAGADAEVRVGAGGLSVTTASGDSAWTWPRVRRRPGAFGGGVQLEHAESGAVLVFADEAVLTALRAHAPGLGGGAAATAGRRLAHPMVVLAAAAGVLVGGLWLALPHLAAALAQRVPVAWEEQFGESVVGSMAPESRRIRDPRVTGPIESVVARLASAQTSPYRFRVVVSADTVVNAFAAPGGWIVVNAGLIRLAGHPDELAGVLAHEMEHVRRRHVTVSLFQRLSWQLLLAVVFGESGGVVGGGADMAGRLTDLAHSRGAELEADAGGAAIMRDARLDPGAMIALLERMRAHSGDAPFAMLSTHPATPSRTAALRTRIAGLRIESPEPALDAAAWRDLRQAAAAAR